MQDDKQLAWHDSPDLGEELAEQAPQDDARDADDARPNRASWDAYRNWLSRLPVPNRRRRHGSLDPALYTWKGYRSWTEEVKRNWNERNAQDGENN